MTAGEQTGSPWADPTTPTETSWPYSGPPATDGRPPYGQPAYGPPPYGQQGAPYGSAPWGPTPWAAGPPRGPRRPGQVTGAAVLSFVQAGLVLCATLYVWLLVSMGRLAAQTLSWPNGGGPLVVEGTVLTLVQLVSIGSLVAAGALALTRRSRLAWRVVLVACLVQVALAGYWAFRLPSLLSELPSGAPGTGAAAFTVVFAAGPVVALGLVLLTPGRSWFDGTPRR